MPRIPCITTIVSLLLIAPVVGVAQQPAESGLRGSGTDPAARTVTPPPSLSAAEITRGTAGSQFATVALSRPSSRASRMLLGTGVGFLAGSAAGSVYGYHQYDTGEAFFSRSFETFLFGAMGGGAGTVIGGLVGGLWPDQRTQPTGVKLTPSTQGGVAISLGLRR